jgi:signal transduction histidine kinase
MCYIAIMQTVTVDWLQSIEALKEVPGDQLQWMIENSRHYALAEGEYLFQAGNPAIGTHIIIAGRIKLYLQQKEGIREVNIIGPKDISGYLPFSRGYKANVNGKVIADAEVMTLPTEKFREMISHHFELTQALVHIMTTRVRDFTSLQQQNEKMMALGKLSAGLVHELNNPASAIVRGSTSLKEHLQLVPEAFKEIMAIKMEEKDVDCVAGKLFEVLGRTEKPALTLMERTEKEDMLRDWMEDHQVQNAGEIAENLLEYGFTYEDLHVIKQHIPTASLSAVFNWINANLVTERMVMDIQQASQRISELVRSVKNFTHMDQGKGKEATDIHSGIRNTLTMLQYRLKKGNVTVVEEFDTTLPPVFALVGELNQVWTNLIDNSLDAMEPAGKGELTIRTEKDHDSVKVSVIDNGPGIPSDIQSSIFDPFFTTKDIGKGTGLGLDVVMQIVRQHHGSVKVQSTPGRTAFVVCFPIKG